MRLAASRGRRLAALAAMVGVAAVAAITVTVGLDSSVSRGAAPSPELVSVAGSAAAPQGAGAAREPSVSADGKLVAYAVVPTDPTAATLAYVRDRGAPANPPVQVPLPAGVVTVAHPVISGDGCTVAFWGLSAVPPATTGTAALYTWSRCPNAAAASVAVAPTVTLALSSAAVLVRPAISTVGTAGNAAAAIAYAAAPTAAGPWHVGLVGIGAPTEQVLTPPAPVLALTTVALSGDATTVVFDAGAVAGSPPTAVWSWKPAGATPLAPVLVAGVASGAAAGVATAMPNVSRDGTTVAFVSNSADFGVTSATLQLYVGPLAGPFRLVTGSSPNTPQTGNVVQPDLTADGTQVAYALETTASAASLAVPVAQPSSVLVARLSDPSATTVDQISAVGGIPVGGTSSAPSISDTGRFTAYESDAGATLSGNAQFPAGTQVWSTERTLSIAASTDFATVDVGSSSAPVSIPVTNPLTAPVAIGQIAPPGPAFTVGPDTCSNQTLAGGATCVVTVVFTPTAAGAVTANLVVAGGDQIATSVLKATGRQLRRALSADDASLSFPSTAVGARGGPLSATIRNSGDVPVSIAASTLQGGSSEQFFVVGTTCAGTTLAVGATCAVSVVALPSSPGTKQASLVVTGSNGESASVALSVVGVGATTTTRPATTTTVRPGQLSANPTTLSFPVTPVGTTSSPLSVAVSNVGGAAVSVNQVSITGGNEQFSVDSDGCRGKQLAAGQTCTVSIDVRPQAGGELTGTLTIGGSRGEATNVTLAVDSSFAPTITLAPGVVRRGDLVNVTGTGFPPLRTVVLQLTTAAGTGQALPLGTAITDPGGEFVAGVVIPQNGIASGGWQIVVVDQPDFAGARAPVLVDQISAAPGAATGGAGIGGIPRPGPVLT